MYAKRQPDYSVLNNHGERAYETVSQDLEQTDGKIPPWTAFISSASCFWLTTNCSWFMTMVHSIWCLMYVLYVAHPVLQLPTSWVAAAALWNWINNGINTDITRFSIFWPPLDLWTCLSVFHVSMCMLTFKAYELVKALKQLFHQTQWSLWFWNIHYYFTGTDLSLRFWPLRWSC